jgi:hypothetical protein
VQPPPPFPAAAVAPRGAASARCRARHGPRPPGAPRRAALPAPPYLCLAAPRGAPLCPPGPALPSSVPGERRQERPGAGPLPTRRPRAPPARPGLPSSHGCRVPSPLFLGTGRVSWSTRRRPSCRCCCAQAAVGAGPIAVGGSLTATGTASVLAAVADAPPAGVPVRRTLPRQSPRRLSLIRRLPLHRSPTRDPPSPP